MEDWAELKSLLTEIRAAGSKGRRKRDLLVNTTSSESPRPLRGRQPVAGARGSYGAADPLTFGDAAGFDRCGAMTP